MSKYFMLVAVLFLPSFSLHPIHVSVCDIEYDEESKSLEIVQKIFLDDLEKAIRVQLNDPQMDITKPGKDRTTDELVKNYLQRHLKIGVNGKEESYNYLGHKLEVDALHAYLEVEKIKKLNSLEVFSDILTTEYDDQVNLVHVKVDGKVRSMKLTESNRKDILEY